MQRSMSAVIVALAVCLVVARTLEAMPLGDRLERKEDFTEEQTDAERKVADVEIKTDISLAGRNFNALDGKRNYGYMPNVFHATRGKRQFVSAVDQFAKRLLRVVDDLRYDIEEEEQKTGRKSGMSHMENMAAFMTPMREN